MSSSTFHPAVEETQGSSCCTGQTPEATSTTVPGPDGASCSPCQSTGIHLLLRHRSHVTSSWNTLLIAMHTTVCFQTQVLNGGLLYILFGTLLFHLIYLRIYSMLTFISFSSFFLATTWCSTEWLHCHFFNQLSLHVQSFLTLNIVVINILPHTFMWTGTSILWRSVPRKGIAGPKGSILNIDG